MVIESVQERGVVETLDAVDRLHGVRTDVDASTFELAAHFADLHSGDSLPTSRTVLAGMERSVQVGGVGTPRIGEFSYAELGARMGMGTWAAKRYVADALDVRHRLPLIWARVQAREARIGNVRLVATQTRHLSLEAAAHVDAAMVASVDGSLAWGRFQSRLIGKIVAADPETAAAREAARVREQFAKRTRSCEEGTAGFYLRSTIGVIARVEATVCFLADALTVFGDTDTEDLRRVRAVLLMANPVQAVELLAALAALRHPEPHEREPKLDPDPGPEPEQFGELDGLSRMDVFARKVGFTPTRLPDFRFDWAKLLPPLTLFLHLSHEDLARGKGGVARWENEGPVTHEFVHEHLRPLHSYTITPVVDPAHLAPVDAYEIPDRHRTAVHLRTPSDAFPFSANLSRNVDIDHTEPYAPALAGGTEKDWSTRMKNLGPLGRLSHRIKTHGRWVLRQPFEGIYLWRDPHGQIYLVDHTGTHKITEPGTPAGKTRAFDPDLELHPADTVVELRMPGSGQPGPTAGSPCASGGEVKAQRDVVQHVAKRDGQPDG